MFPAGELFDFDHTIAASIFKNTTNAWEALSSIQAWIEDFTLQLRGNFTEIQPQVWVGKDTVIDPSVRIIGPAIIGQGCYIRHTAYIRENVIIGNGVVVGNSTEVKNAIVFDQVQIPHFNYVGDSILGYQAHLGAGVILSNFKSTKDTVRVKTTDGAALDTGLRKFGALIGDHVEVGCNAVLNPGTIIGRNSLVYPLVSVRGTIPADHILKSSDRLIPKK